MPTNGEVDYVVVLREQPDAFLAMLGDDGGQWGRAFCQFVRKNHAVDLPEQWVAGWFSNCIGYNHELLRDGPMSLQDSERLPQAVSESVVEIAGIKLRVAVLDDGRRIVVDDDNFQALLLTLTDHLPDKDPP